MQQNQASILSGGNAIYVSELYARYVADPGSVDPSWADFFVSLGDDGRSVLAELKGAPWGKNGAQIIGAKEEAAPTPAAKKGAAPAVGVSVDELRRATTDSVRALMLVRAYRARGHLQADLDPLKLAKRPVAPELDYKFFGFTDADLDRPIFIDHVLGLESATLRQIDQILRATYCGTVGVEFSHIQDPDQKGWIQKRIESEHNQTQFSERGKLAILERLIEAEGLERFLQVKYTGTKRFGLDGGETLIPALEQILKRGSQLGLKEVVLGMAHRGRLNVLTNFMKKPFAALFSEFQGNSSQPEDVQGSGDVKYHLGTSADRDFDGNVVHLSLTANPSHLEVVDPVVLGKVRAKQSQLKNTDRTQAMALIIHGDAAFAGQGIVAECFAMSQLEGYTTGGTIHFIVNNQIGFTTSPRYSRSGPYCTDVAKMVQAPIFHVNADDPEAVVHVARVATEFRQEFKHDVVIDMVCYRRHGHNESDEPAFTQPLMYKKIGSLQTTRQLYAQKLVSDGVVTQEQADKLYADFQATLEADFQAAKSFKVNKADWLEGKWAGLGALHEEEEMRDERTGVAVDALKEVGAALSRIPDGFHLNPKIARQLEAKKKMFETGQGVDWATAEALAFGTLAVEGTPVRLSGQDSGRGTFSQRHSVLIDQEDESRYVPLNSIRAGQANYEVIDSLLSEAGVLGYEYGYSLAEPSGLTVWEAQFGDFVNGAQVMIDCFLAAGETRWLRMSGLVMLAPHGYEGQGAEHSSARFERYLQSCAEDNWQVCNFTTPANYFHALRRQVCRNFRKPLVVMTPKSLLRHKLCVSALEDFGPQSRFYRVLFDYAPLVADDKVRRIVFCSGKVYYDLLEERTKRNIKDVALVRVEQLYPWPKETIASQIRRYSNAEIVWCQEEPGNMGAWTFVMPRFNFILEELNRKQRQAMYCGRIPSAAAATGDHHHHDVEQIELVNNALTAPLAELRQPFRRATKLGEMHIAAK
ncbi:MAG TPA: 2-oxoglutarate dehydrogenase E1 component [Magnetospirillaceae bacterium]|jgi:2-oxoglutarate dehydrogenase E1 component